MSLLTRLWYALGLAPDDGEGRPCNVSGHDWTDGRVSGYYTQGVPHFGPGNSWKVEKRLRRECRKCGDVRFDRVRIGKIRADIETDEMTVIQ